MITRFVPKPPREKGGRGEDGETLTGEQASAFVHLPPTIDQEVRTEAAVRSLFIAPIIVRGVLQERSVGIDRGHFTTPLARGARRLSVAGRGRAVVERCLDRHMEIWN